MFSKYLKPQLIIILILGFVSGLPLGLSGSILQAWYTQSNIDIAHIGMLSLIGLPYTYKFFWAPFFDRFELPFLTRRRGWLMGIQFALIIVIFSMSFVNPTQDALVLAGLAFVMASLSATQDILIDAYRTELPNLSQRGMGAAMAVTGYRLAMVVSGGLALICAAEIGFEYTYQLMALLMLAGPIAVFFAKEQKIERVVQPFAATVVGSVHSIFKLHKILWCLAFVVLYKVGDAFAHSLLTNFLLSEIGFTLKTIGTVNKIFGLLATIVGVFVGGHLLNKIGLFKSLMVFGFLQSFSNLGFYILDSVGADLHTFIMVVFFECVASGMGSAALVVFIMGLCKDVRYTATQFALLSAFSAFARVWMGPAAGVFVASNGWANFFTLSFVISLPGLAILYFLKDLPMFEEDTAVSESMDSETAA